MYLLARLVSHATPLGLVLAAAKYVSDEALPAEKTSRGWSQLVLGKVAGEGAGHSKACLDQWPTSPDPVAVAAVDELVRATGEAALWGVLPRG